MAHEGDMSSEVMDAWSSSRAGAWAGRGFDYQHLVSTLLLIRQWAGLDPSGSVIPEGFEDCVIELEEKEFWVQIKSRKKGGFSSKKVERILADVEAKSRLREPHTKIRCAVILEQPCIGISELGVHQLIDDSPYKVFVCPFPGEDSVALVHKKLGVAKVIAEGIVNDLYRLVSQSSKENASRTFQHRRRISKTEVERFIFERLEAIDPSAIERALAEGTLEIIDFNNPISDTAFYQGVKAKPGHVAAGLVFDRPDDIQTVVGTLKKYRQVLLSGPSGAGKSALMWLSVNSLAGQICWYQVTARASITDANEIISFIRARRPSEESPIGLIVDELGTGNTDLWDLLTRELRGYPFVYFIGSIRQEDVSLLTTQSDTEIITVGLDQKLAEGVWSKLRADEQTAWKHWAEPFEQARGLMLEYVHLLTQGKRLSAIIDEQIELRQQEKRDDELAIIRCASLLFTYGAEIRTSELCRLLEISPQSASRALSRLIDEHLIKESRPGILGGMHALRSEALSKASHDEVVYLSESTLWTGLAAVTLESMPGVIQSLLSACSVDKEEKALRELAHILEANADVDVWVSILTGLGLATVERYVAILIEVLEQHSVQPAQWPLASMLGCDAQIDIPELKEFEQWGMLRTAILAFRALPRMDLRRACVEQLPKDSAIFESQSLQQTNRLLSCLVPICGGKPIQPKMMPKVIGVEPHNIKQIAALLSTAYLISPGLADELVQSMGGERLLYDWFRAENPWVTRPVIELGEDHRKTVRSDLYCVPELEPSDPHAAVCDICETLLALSPGAAAAASDALNPQGQPMVVSDQRLWSKNIPRSNSVVKSRVAWNVAFRQIMLSRSISLNQTEYTQQMAVLVKQTEKLLRSYTEKWIRRKLVGNNESLIVEINDVIEKVNAHAFARPQKPAADMTSPMREGSTEDSLGALLVGTLGNLITRLPSIPAKENTRGVALFAGSLASQSYEQQVSDIWRTHPTPPVRELKAIGKRLRDIACILHEIASGNSPESAQAIVGRARQSSPGKAISSSAMRCRILAEQRFNNCIKMLERKLKSKGWEAECWARKLDGLDSVHWPAKDVAITVKLKDFGGDPTWIEESLSLGQKYLGNGWRFRVVPIINEIVITPMALMPASPVPLPDLDFADDWKGEIKYEFFHSQLVVDFDEAMSACMQISGIVTCRDINELHPDEETAFLKAKKSFESSYNRLIALVQQTDSDYANRAWECLDRTWAQVVEEFEEGKAGRRCEEPLCLDPYLALQGKENDRLNETNSIRFLMLQEECIQRQTYP